MSKNKELQELLNYINNVIKQRYNCSFSYNIVDDGKTKTLEKIYPTVDSGEVLISDAKPSELISMLTMMSKVLDDVANN